ncbi:MAG TPA: outer membrane protein assembly factor BamD [Gammaproteobacteria bacterium]
MRLILKLTALLALISLAGCAGMGADETAGWSAQQFYEKGREALDGKDYQSALDYYSKLEARYPYGAYTEQAQLETAYAHFKAEEPAAAVAAADRFIKLHPRHKNVDYAYYMRGLASFEAERAFLEGLFKQDTSKRDPTVARESFNYFRELVTQFPDSKYTPDAIQRMTWLRQRLAQHELHVADYYLRRGAPLSAANRAKYVVENYQGTPEVADALAVMVQAYRQMQQNELAEDALRVLRLNHPDHPFLQQEPPAATGK